MISGVTMELSFLFNKILLILLSSSLVNSGLSHDDEDFAFELDDDDDDIINDYLDKPTKIVPLQRLYGIPDSTAYVGRLFQFKIPADAFSGTLNHFEVRACTFSLVSFF